MADFIFMRPFWLLGLPFVLILMRVCVRAVQKQNAWHRVCDPHLLPGLSFGKGGSHSFWPLFLLALGWCGAVLALAGPAWEKLPRPSFKTGHPVVVVMDLSQSMTAQDVEPVRFLRASFKMHDLLDRNADGVTGLVVYSDEPYVIAPLTEDAAVIRSFLPLLSPGLLPGNGSRPDRALEEAETLLLGAQIDEADVFLFTDSIGDRPDDTFRVAERLKRQGHRLSVLMIGSEDGAPVPDDKGGFLSDENEVPVLAQLDTAILKKLAKYGGGKAVMASGSGRDIDALLPKTDPALKRLDFLPDRWRDMGIYLVCIPLLLALFAFRRGWVLVVGLCLCAPKAQAEDLSDLFLNPNQRALRALEENKPEEAARLFTDPAWRGVALYRAKQYEAASASFKEKEKALDALYNQGNALAYQKKISDAIKAYEAVLEQDPDHEDAAYNKKLLEDMQNDQKNNQDNNNQGGQGGNQGGQGGNQGGQGGNQGGQGGNQGGQGGAGQDSQSSRAPAAPSRVDTPETEGDQAMQNLLKRVPDDPIGLLRNRIKRDYDNDRYERKEKGVW